MGWLSGLVQFVVAIPKLWSILKEIKTAVHNSNLDRHEKNHDKSVKKLKDAETEDEIKEAMRDIARNP
jgi:hypothetical protein